jgi:hypothetical protein
MVVGASAAVTGGKTVSEKSGTYGNFVHSRCNAWAFLLVDDVIRKEFIIFEEHKRSCFRMHRRSIQKSRLKFGT